MGSLRAWVAAPGFFHLLADVRGYPDGEKKTNRGDRPKTFICSISAIQIGPGVTLEIDREVLLCRIDANTNPEGQFAAAVAQLPLLLVQHETEEAKDYALRRARELFPVAEGWSNHATSLIEIPR